MLDKDLAEIYQVTTGNLNLAIKRNKQRFPNDFMLQLTDKEFKNLILQSARSSWGGSRYLPYAFTEHGVAMLSSVLNSPRAIQMSIYIIRAFIQMRELISIDKDLELGIFLMRSEQKEMAHEIEEIIYRLDRLTDEPLKTPGPLGFQP